MHDTNTDTNTDTWNKVQFILPRYTTLLQDKDFIKLAELNKAHTLFLLNFFDDFVVHSESDPRDVPISELQKQIIALFYELYTEYYMR